MGAGPPSDLVASTATPGVTSTRPVSVHASRLIGQHKPDVDGCSYSLRLTPKSSASKEFKFLCVQARIQKLGGHILHRNGVRVMGALAMSRAIGDHALRPYGELLQYDTLL